MLVSVIHLQCKIQPLHSGFFVSYALIPVYFKDPCLTKFPLTSATSLYGILPASMQHPDRKNSFSTKEKLTAASALLLCLALALPQFCSPEASSASIISVPYILSFITAGAAARIEK